MHRTRREKALTCHDEDLYRQDDEHVIDVEPRVPVVERQEPVDRQLRPKIVVLPTEHLLAHSRADLRLEVENRPKAEIPPFPALIVLRMLDSPTSPKRVHPSINVLVQMQPFLRFRDTAPSRHVQSVQEVWVTVVQLPADPRHGSRRHSTKSLLLAGSEITKDSNILRKDVLSCTHNRNGRVAELLVTPLRVWTATRHGILLEFAQDIPDLQAFFEVIVLVRIDQLQVLAAVEDNSVILIVRFAVTQNWVPG